jgi:hypothetical protein
VQQVTRAADEKCGTSLALLMVTAQASAPPAFRFPLTPSALSVRVRIRVREPTWFAHLHPSRSCDMISARIFAAGRRQVTVADVGHDDLELAADGTAAKLLDAAGTVAFTKIR